MIVEDVMRKMVELFLVLFFLSIGIFLRFEFYGGREGEKLLEIF